MTLFEKGMNGKPIDDCFVFDAHAHIGPRCELDRDTSANRFLRHMDSIGIDMSCVMIFPSSSGIELSRHNDFVHTFISLHPDRFKGYCWINPNYPELMADELERCFDHFGFAGIKIHTHNQYPYDGERYAPMYEFAEARGIPILAHTWGDESVRKFAAMARKYPEATFLVAHSGANDMEINIFEAKRTPNLILELAFSGGTPWMVERFVREVGPERVIWGSDTILFSSAHQIGKVLFADITENDKRKILGLNARRIFRL